MRLVHERLWKVHWRNIIYAWIQFLDGFNLILRMKHKIKI
jgi:hypothetical protein